MLNNKNKNNHNNNYRIIIKTIIQAKSLIELIIIFFIITILITAFWFYNGFDKKISDKNFLKLKQLQYILHLARSEAIRLRTKVYLCPSNNRQTCYYNWTSGIMIFLQNRDTIQVLHYSSMMFMDPMLRFKFFGNQQDQKITFLPNGLTINNGHFCTDNGLHCLYINQAGKIYIKTKK